MVCKLIESHDPNFISFNTRTNADAAESAENKSSDHNEIIGLFPHMTTRENGGTSSGQDRELQQQTRKAASAADKKGGISGEHEQRRLPYMRTRTWASIRI